MKRKVKNIISSSSFKKGLLKLKKKHLYKDILRLKEIIEKLKNFEISNQYKNHPLKGKWKGYNELHVRDDLLLIYKYIDEDLYIYLELKDLTNHKSGFSNTKN